MSKEAPKNIQELLAGVAQTQEPQELSEDKLGELAELCNRMTALEAEKAALENQAAEIDKEINSLSFETIPELFDGMGIDGAKGLTLANGKTIRVKSGISFSLAKNSPKRAAALEFTAGWRIKRAGHVALEGFPPVGILSLTRGDGREEGEGVRVERVVEEILGRGIFHDMSEVHDSDRVADVTHHVEIVGDEEVAEVEPGLQTFEEVDDLGLDGYV